MNNKKTVRDLMNDFIQVYEKLGGAEGLLKWAQKSDENMKFFCETIMKKMPNRVAADLEKFLSDRKKR